MVSIPWLLKGYDPRNNGRSSVGVILAYVLCCGRSIELVITYVTALQLPTFSSLQIGPSMATLLLKLNVNKAEYMNDRHSRQLLEFLWESLTRTTRIYFCNPFGNVALMKCVLVFSSQNKLSPVAAAAIKQGEVNSNSYLQ